MSGIDPQCHPPTTGCGEPVCSNCFEDDDLRAIIVSVDGPPGCHFCGEDDAPTIPVDDIADHIRERAEAFYGKAGDQLPYESREGGYQGWNVDTYDLLTDSLELGLPRDNGDLLSRLIDEIGDDQWCEYDWLTLEPDESLMFSWEEFCRIVTSERRFFFHNLGAEDDRSPDERSPIQLLSELASHIENRGLIRLLEIDTRLFRARSRSPDERHETAAALGPPPSEFATQSNRMNPPGISMFYGADRLELAVAEIRGETASVGEFATLRPLRILDLADLPEVPGLFSSADRMEIMVLGFLNQFSEMIVRPVERTDRTHIDYIPTQVFSEFLRDHEFLEGPIHGVRYLSATRQEGANLVLFAGPEDVEGATAPPEYGELPPPMLRLVRTQHV